MGMWTDGRVRLCQRTSKNLQSESLEASQHLCLEDAEHCTGSLRFSGLGVAFAGWARLLGTTPPA